MTPGIRILPSGQLDVFPDLPLVLVADVGRLDGVRLGVDLEQQVGDVLQLDVVDVRAVAAAPADVEADQLLGQPLERVVDDLDAELQVLAVLLDGTSPGRTSRR